MLHSTAAAAMALIALAPTEAALLQSRALVHTLPRHHYRALPPLSTAGAQGEATDVQQELAECLLDAEGPDVSRRPSRTARIPACTLASSISSTRAQRVCTAGHAGLHRPGGG